MPRSPQHRKCRTGRIELLLVLIFAAFALWCMYNGASLHKIFTVQEQSQARAVVRN